MAFDPNNVISLSALVELVVAHRHGQDAIAKIENVTYGPVTSFEDGETHQQRKQYVFRAGKKISSKKDSRRRDEAEKQITTALSEGKLTARVLLKSGIYTPVPTRYWQGDEAMVVFLYGNLNNPEHSEQDGQPVYVDGPEVLAWVKASPGNGVTGPQVKVDPYHTGGQGRPTVSHLVVAEFERRIDLANGSLESTLTEQARALNNWVSLEHPKGPPMTAGTIENAIRDRWHKLPKVPTK